MNLHIQLVTCKANIACSLCSKLIPARTLFWKAATDAGWQNFVICTDHIPSNATGLDYVDDPEQPIRVLTARCLDVRNALIPQLLESWDSIYDLTEEDFEELVLDRLLYSGMQAFRTGRSNRKDGGVDIIFWVAGDLPILGAVQVKHHRSPAQTTGPDTVRDLAGVMAAHRFNVGFIVTNTEFTDDAKAFAYDHPTRIQFRDRTDLKRWIEGNFDLRLSQSETRTLDLCPGVSFPVPNFL